MSIIWTPYSTTTIIKIIGLHLKNIPFIKIEYNFSYTLTKSALLIQCFTERCHFQLNYWREKNYNCFCSNLLLNIFQWILTIFMLILLGKLSWKLSFFFFFFCLHINPNEVNPSVLWFFQRVCCVYPFLLITLSFASSYKIP